MSTNDPQGNDAPASTEENVLEFPVQEIPADELAPEDPMLSDYRLRICLTGDKRKVLSTKVDNPILKEIGEIANSPDLVETQSAIYAYEIGFEPLYRTFDRIVKLGHLIASADNAIIDAALKDIAKDIKDGLGYVNIGRPKMPKPSDKVIAEFKADPCSFLIDFFYASADGSTRSDYRRITSWCQRHNRHNIVNWLSNEIVYDGTPTSDNPSGIEKCGKGIKGALKFVRYVERKETNVLVSSDMSPIDYAKAICADAKTFMSIPKPDWVKEKENAKGEPANFMILASVHGDQMVIYDVIDGNKRAYEKAINDRHAQHFASAFDQRVENRSKILEQIQNISKLISAPEFLIWQDGYMTYLMPIYPTWIDKNKNIVPCKEGAQYCIVLQIHDILEKGSEFDATFPVPFGDDGSSNFPDGYSTQEVNKIRAYKGDLDIEWVGRTQRAFKCMGVTWERMDRNSFLPGKPEANGLIPYLPAAPVGFDYVRMAIFSTALIISDNIDFAQAKREFAKWKEVQYMASSSYSKNDIDVLVAVENGVIGVWLYPIKATKKKPEDKDTYNYDGQFIQIGTTSHNLLRGKWLVPEKRIERIWNFISHPWQLVIPEDVDEYTIGEGDHARECLSYDDALLMMATNPEQSYRGDERLPSQEQKDLHYQRLVNLCNDKEAGDEWVEQWSETPIDYPEDNSDRMSIVHKSKIVRALSEEEVAQLDAEQSKPFDAQNAGVATYRSYRKASSEEKGNRLVLPFVLNCGAIWLSLPTK